MNCNQAREFFDGFLLADNCVMVPEDLLAHVAVCPDCDREYEKAQTAMAALQVNHSLYASSELRERIMVQLAEASTMDCPPRVIRHERPFSRTYIGLAAAAVVIFAAVTGYNWLAVHRGQPEIQLFSTFAQAAEVMQRVRSLCINARMRTLPRDNFDLIWLEADPVPIKITEAFSPDMRWRVEKEGRVVVMDGASTTMVIGFESSAPMVLKAGLSAAGFVGWLQPLLAIDKLFTHEQEVASSEKSRLEISQGTSSDGEATVQIVVKADAQGNFTQSDYLRNKSVLESDNTRTYIFDATDHRLKSMQVDVQTSAGPVRVFETTSIEYDTNPDQSLFALEIPPDAISQDLRSEEAPTSDTSSMQPDDAAKGFFQACSSRDWATAEIFGGWMIKRPDVREHLGGLEVISIGKPFQSGRYPGWFVPYEIRFKSGDVRKWNLAVRNDSKQQQWQVDGGI